MTANIQLSKATSTNSIANSSPVRALPLRDWPPAAPQDHDDPENVGKPIIIRFDQSNAQRLLNTAHGIKENGKERDIALAKIAQELSVNYFGDSAFEVALMIDDTDSRARSLANIAHNDVCGYIPTRLVAIGKELSKLNAQKELSDLVTELAIKGFVKTALDIINSTEDVNSRQTMLSSVSAICLSAGRIKEAVEIAASIKDPRKDVLLSQAVPIILRKDLKDDAVSAAKNIGDKEIRSGSFYLLTLSSIKDKDYLHALEYSKELTGTDKEMCLGILFDKLIELSRPVEAETALLRMEKPAQRDPLYYKLSMAYLRKGMTSPAVSAAEKISGPDRDKQLKWVSERMATIGHFKEALGTARQITDDNTRGILIKSIEGMAKEKGK